MEGMSYNTESPGRIYGDSSQLTNWILDSGATCHMIPDILNFIPGLSVETYEYIEVSDGNFITSKQSGQFQIKMHGNNGKPFIATCN